MTAAPAAYLNKALQPTAYSLRFAGLRCGFRQRLSFGVRPCGRKANPQDREASQPPPLACHAPRTLMRHIDQRNIFL